MSIRPATIEDIPAIRAIALRTWPVAYGTILSPDQLTYMLDLMYSEASLRDQLTTKHHRFLLFIQAGQCLGFAAYEHDHARSGRTRLHKLYALPEAQGTGVGTALLSHVIDVSRAAGERAVELNVNRFNKARSFYERHGFQVIRDEVIDIGNRYVMDDHVMERPIG